MTGPTHRKFSVSWACLLAITMYRFNLISINYYLALPLLFCIARYGALFPDVDHSWDKVKDKTFVNFIINKLIHLTGGSHRSWQTHSWDIYLVVCMSSVIIPQKLLEAGKIDYLNFEILRLILYGFLAGWGSHLFSDMLTSAGVRLTCFSSSSKVALVPKNIGGIRFNTGDTWEAFVYKVVKFINIFLGMACILYPMIDSGLHEKILAIFGLQLIK